MPTTSRCGLAFAAALGAALALACSAISAPSQTSPAQPAAAPASKLPSFTPTRFTVIDQGLSTPGTQDILLLPGLASSRDVWTAEAKLLAPTYHLHLVQIDGFAGQPAGANATGPVLAPVVEELHQYLAANHLQPALIGHSLGGLLSLMLAQAHPEDVSRILIVDTLPFYALVFNPNATVELMIPQAKAIGDSMLAIPDDQFAAMQPQFTAAMVKSPVGARAVAASSIASDRKVFVKAMQEDLLTDLRPALAGIKTPTTVLYPIDPTVQKDPAAVDSLYTTAYKSMPNVTFHRIENSRHFIMYDQPEVLHTAIQTFLAAKP